MSVRVNRRTVLQLLGQVLLAASAVAAPVRSLFDAGRWAGISPMASRSSYTRRYRVQATVSLFSLPQETSGLPARFEFRPRSFLRLVFEHDPNAGGPTLRSLIPQEDA